MDLMLQLLVKHQNENATTQKETATPKIQIPSSIKNSPKQKVQAVTPPQL